MGIGKEWNRYQRLQLDAVGMFITRKDPDDPWRAAAISLTLTLASYICLSFLLRPHDPLGSQDALLTDEENIYLLGANFGFKPFIKSFCVRLLQSCVEKRSDLAVGLSKLWPTVDTACL